MTLDRSDRAFGEVILDEVLGTEVDWRDLVVRYPRLALLAAGAGGILIGLRHGPALLAAMSDAVGQRAARAVETLTAQLQDEAGGDDPRESWDGDGDDEEQSGDGELDDFEHDLH